MVPHVQPKTFPGFYTLKAIEPTAPIIFQVISLTGYTFGKTLREGDFNYSTKIKTCLKS
uniref:Uncharacterized protein n=1 Tax=Anguilla anguilla TaxID=7936 RepID=A0A0E9T4T4_ANGAN